MSALRTFFAWQAAEHTRASAQTLREMRWAGRQRELRARGWARYSSLPEDYGAAEAVLAAQQRARIEQRYGRRGEPYTGPAIVGLVLGVSGIITIFAASTVRGSLGGLALAVVTVVACGLWARQVKRREQRRSTALAKAKYDLATGRCGWCGQVGPHVLEGEDTSARVFHALEIEQFISPVPPAPQRYGVAGSW